MQGLRGQMTIYLSITFTLILSMFLGAYEAARLAALSAYAECALEAGLISAFGEYNRELLDRFDLLYVDMSYMSNQPDSARLSERINEYTSSTLDLSEGQDLLFARDIFDIEGTNVSMTGYRLATDKYGESFKSQAVNYMENLVSLGLKDKLQEWVAVKDQYNLSEEAYTAKQDQALSQINEGFTNARADDEWDETVIKKNIADSFMFSGVDVLIFGFDGLHKGSSKGINLANTIERREINKGIGDFELDEANISEEFIFDEYILDKLGCFTRLKQDSCLDYETEYVLFGAESDGTNLSFTITELFFIRSAANVITIYQDKDKMSAIKDVATVLSQICKYVPEQAWEAQIVCTWAAFEGVSDVKHLLMGERIPLIKKGDDMRVSLSGLSEGISGVPVPDGGMQEIEDESYELGLTYRDYLRILLLTVPPYLKTTRVMDMVEMDMRQISGNEYFRLDACVDAVSVVMTVKTNFGEQLVGQRKYYYF